MGNEMIKKIWGLSYCIIKVLILIYPSPIYASDEASSSSRKEYPQGRYELIQPLEMGHDDLYQLLITKKDIPEHYVGVKTTGIACRFGCPAGPPLQKNCFFSKRLHDLIGQGLRECKVCKPLSYNAPEDLIEYLDSIQRANFPDKAPETIPARTSAWVKKVHDTDLLKYICTKRSNGVLSNLHSTTVKVISTLTYHRYWTPIGSMVACFSQAGLCLLEFSDRRMLEAELLGLQKKHKATFHLKPHTLSHQLGEELDEYFKGIRQEFSIPLDQRGSEFQLSVWSALKDIPYGTTTSYKKQAISLGKPDAVRAVANANGNNSVSILVPCHRVIGENGDMTGYGGGIERKQFLLDFERHAIQRHVTTSLVVDDELSTRGEKKRDREPIVSEGKVEKKKKIQTTLDFSSK